MCLLSRFSRVWLCVTLWTVACQAPLSMEFFRQECWRGLPCPPPGDFPDSGIEPMSPALQADSLPLNQWGSPMISYLYVIPFTFQSKAPSALKGISVPHAKVNFYQDFFCLKDRSVAERMFWTVSFPLWAGRRVAFLLDWKGTVFCFLFFLRHCFYLGLLCSISSPVHPPHFKLLLLYVMN